MPRTLRPYAPRAAFHITARTQGGERWFTPEIRSRIYADVEEAALSCGHRLLAQVIMPNHLHIVVRQGRTPLGWMMQRVMQRAAYFVQKLHRNHGHVFGRPYWSCVCATPAYVRRAIVYAHLNPCAANICANPGDYIWSSHASYLAMSADADLTKFGYLDGMMLFAHNSVTVPALRHAYRRFVEYVIERRRSGSPGDWLLPNGPARHFIPVAPYGDAHWADNYESFALPMTRPRPAKDVVSEVKELLKRLDSDCDIETLRQAGRLKALAPLRRNIIAALLSSGHRASAIARSLRVSPTLVSRVAASMRAAATRQQ
ncbi:MAG TPA: transposase [Longimicrobiales bacterium]